MKNNNFHLPRPNRRSRPARRASLIPGVTFLALVATGCTLVGPDFVRPEAPLTEDWIETDQPAIKGEPADLAAWWQVFNDPILDALIETAYRQNLSLQIAGLRILEARAQLGIAVGNLYPQQQVGRGGIFSVNSSKNVANTAAADLSFWNADLGFDVAWELDFWGRFRRAVQSADANLIASVANYDDVLVTLTAEVARIYVVIRSLQERLELARQNVRLQERSLRITDVRFRNGLVTELDVQQSRGLLTNTQASIPVLEIALRQALNALDTLLGRPPGESLAGLSSPQPIPVPPAEVAVGIPAELLRRRPDISRAEFEMAAQSARIGLAKADLYPTFSLTGSIGLAASANAGNTNSGSSGFSNLFEADSFELFAGPSFTWNILNYGRIKNNVRVQDARFQQLVVNYQDTVLRAAQEVEDAMVAFLQSQEQVRFLAESERAAQRSVDLSLTQYRDGVIDYNRVVNSQSFLVQQQDDLTVAQADIATSLIAMYKALGGGWELRQGKPFVSPETQAVMGERTDWGELLPPTAETPTPSPEETAKPLRKPNW